MEKKIARIVSAVMTGFLSVFLACVSPMLVHAVDDEIEETTTAEEEQSSNESARE